MMLSKRNEETRSRSTKRSSTGAPTAPTDALCGSTDSLCCCSGSILDSQGDRKKTDKEKKEKEKKEKKEKKKKPAATITLSDLKRAGTSMGAQNAFSPCHGSSMGVQNTMLRPDDLTQLEGAVFNSTMFEKGPMSPLPPTPVRVVSMPVQQQQQQQQSQLHPQVRVAMPAPSFTLPEDWREEMKEMKALMKDSMRKMMALLPEPNHVTALGSGSHGAQSPPVGVPRDANFTNPILFAEGHAMAPLALHTGGDSLPVGQPVAVRAHVLGDENIQADV